MAKKRMLTSALLLLVPGVLAAGELTPDGEEVVESNWFGRDELPLIPPVGSIARRMIDAWRDEAALELTRRLRPDLLADKSDGQN